MVVKHLSDQNPDGTLLGQASTDLIGFYGLTTPIARPALTAIGTATSTTTLLELNVKRLTATLVNLGLITTDG